MEKKVAALVSVFSNSFVIVLKIFVGVVSGSVSVISEAIHSLGDLAASFIAFFSISKSSQPADEHHQFGHGKYEDLAGFIEALLIIATAIYIFYVASEKIISGNYAHIETTPGIAVMLFSVVLNFIVSSYLYKVAKKTDSIALYTDAQHLSADIYSSLAIMAGLVLTKITSWYILDPILAIIVGFIVLRTGVKLTRASMHNLLDASLPEEDKTLIKDAIEEFKCKGLQGVKTIKTSKSGAKKVVQMTIYLDPGTSLSDAHTLCDDIEDTICSRLKNAEIVIHPEPYDN